MNGIIISKRQLNGSSLIELVCGLLLAIPVFILLFDSSMLVIGVQINEKVCREAARMAASGEPDSAEARASFVISQAAKESPSMIADLHLVCIENTAAPGDIKYAQLNGGSISGTVAVTTVVVVKSLVVHWFFPGQHYLNFSAKQGFPYTYVFPGKGSTSE